MAIRIANVSRPSQDAVSTHAADGVGASDDRHGHFLSFSERESSYHSELDS